MKSQFINYQLQVAVFLLVFVVIAGAWLGFWVVRKLVLTEDGSVDTSTSRFVAWSIRILAVVMILQVLTISTLSCYELLFRYVVLIVSNLQALDSKLDGNVLLSEFHGSYIGNIGIIIRASPLFAEENN